MIGYVTIGTVDMERAKSFYTRLLEPLGATIMMDMGRFAAIGASPEGPWLAVCTPYNEQAPEPGNGNMVALQPGSRELVDSLYASALELGGSDEGAPGERGDGFYGAYFRDPDGNKLCFFHLG